MHSAVMTDPATLADKVERAARAIADSRYRRRLTVIAASQNTDRPISCPGPFDGMDYLIPAERWDMSGVPDFIRDEYRADARAALAADLEDKDLLAAFQRTDGESAEAEALLTEIRARELDV